MQLLNRWSGDWSQTGRNRAIGAGSYENYITLGLYAHGGMLPTLTRLSSSSEGCVAVNRFLKQRFPGQSWTSIAIVHNPSIGCVETSKT